MHNFLANMNLIEIGGYVLAGGLVVVGIFNGQLRQRRVDEDSTAKNLIENLKTTVDLQEKTIQKMQLDMAAHTKHRDEEMASMRDSLNHMQGRNAVLEDLFKGRDPAMQLFLKESPSLIEMTRQNNVLAKETSEAVTNLTNAITALVQNIQPKEV